MEEPLDLPPGFRFHPTDEEIITYYLTEKVMNSSFSATAIGEADLNKCEPWNLPKKGKTGERDWYLFCQRDRKYPTGMRTNRATESGYWKATGRDKEIYKRKGNRQKQLVGMKKTLVFYRGRAPKGEKTNWVMHEFRLGAEFASYNHLPKDEWVVSRVFHKNNAGAKMSPISEGLIFRMNSIGELDLLDFSSLPALMDPSYDDFKGTNPPSSSDHGHYLPSSIFINSNQHQMPPVNPEDHRNCEIPNSSSYGGLHPPLQQNFSNNLAAGVQPCKMEPFPSGNQSVASVSRDACLSSEKNADSPSAAVSKRDDAGVGRGALLFEDLEVPSGLVPLSDLECLWEDYC